MVAGILVLVGGAAALIFGALRQNIVYFYGPSELSAAGLSQGARFRLGGLVEEGSILREQDGTVRFSVTDGIASVPVHFAGVLPDLFREGQGVVTEGHLEQGVFLAETVLAKHDERYMPREVVDTLKRAGTWRGDGEPLAPAMPPAGKP
jgi:cytochrome c-type biogenesis protein CcmE